MRIIKTFADFSRLEGLDTPSAESIMGVSVRVTQRENKGKNNG